MCVCACVQEKLPDLHALHQTQHVGYMCGTSRAAKSSRENMIYTRSLKFPVYLHCCLATAKDADRRWVCP